MDGEAEAPRFLLWEKFLNKPLVSENNRCRIHLAMKDETFDVVLEGLSFRGAPLALKFRADGKKLLDLPPSPWTSFPSAPLRSTSIWRASRERTGLPFRTFTRGCGGSTASSSRTSCPSVRALI